MRVVSIICILIFLLIQPPLVAAQRSTSPPSRTQQEAERLWELAITAKGGREHLHSVRNMLVSITTRNYRTVELHAFPDKFWRLTNEPEPFGRGALMYNLERGFGYTATEGGNPPRDKAVKLHESSLGGGKIELEDAQLFYLMETRWVKPALIGVSEGEVGRRRADVVRTTIGDRIVDFYLDRETHLPLRVALISDTDGSTYSYETYYDYATIEGIQMPSMMSVRRSGKLSLNFQFNVDYDRQLFERPPSSLAAPDVWKATLRQ